VAHEGVTEKATVKNGSAHDFGHGVKPVINEPKDLGDFAGRRVKYIHDRSPL
jgi:hypothetical protein